MPRPTQTFTLGQVLTVTTDRFLCPIADLYPLLNFMTGGEIYTHQLPRAMQECAPWLLRQFPNLALANQRLCTLEKNLTKDAQLNSKKVISLWLYSLRRQGLLATYAVSPIPADDHDWKRSIDELASMIGKDKIVIVAAPREETRDE